MCGIITSLIMRSGPYSRAMASPSCPSAAVSTVKSCPRRSFMNVRNCSLSSATKTVTLFPSDTGDSGAFSVSGSVLPMAAWESAAVCGGWAGSSSVKRVPFPGVLSTVISPLCKSI